ncbi:MAG: hypothetical protein IJK03_02605 [Oscillospiraceae bacterium]|nr:hypothetical protein [Oscillospiraceae bacterium]
MGKRRQQFDTVSTALYILLSAAALVLAVLCLIGRTLHYAWLIIVAAGVYYLIRAAAQLVHRREKYRLKAILLFLLALACAGGAYLAKVCL